MIRKYIYGTPFDTDAVISSLPGESGSPAYGEISTQEGFSFTYIMNEDDIVYGLGESGATAMSATVPMIRTILRTSARSTPRTISSSLRGKSRSACSSTILPR